jgi:hypothetical protein
MQIQRVTGLLRGIAAARGWLIEHAPLTGSAAGYDLFLKVANDSVGNRPIMLGTLLAEMGHPEKVILRQFAKMEAAGLLAAQPAGLDMRARTFLPTEKFLGLLQGFRKQSESTFILRENLRDKQLLVVTDDLALRDFAESLYDHFYDLGWCYLHNFGSVCFLMASLVARVATSYGYRARVASCYIDISKDEKNFLLGAEGRAGPGQIDGHAVCILEEKLLIDFGLGNLRRIYRRDFAWAIACEFRPCDAVMGGIAFPDGEQVVWKDDWQSPGSAAELARYAPHLDELYRKYESWFR